MDGQTEPPLFQATAFVIWIPAFAGMHGEK